MLNTAGGPNLMWKAFNEFGRPMDFLFWWPFIGTPNAHIWAKPLSLIAWISSACLVFYLITKGGFLAGSQAWAIAVLLLVIPAFDLLGELSLWMNVCAVLLFWAACAITLKMVQSHSKVFLRMLCLLLFFVSFNLNSHLSWFYAVGVALLYLKGHSQGRKGIFLKVGHMLRHYPDFLLLPIAFYIGKNIFTPTATTGIFANYNKPNLSFERMSTGYLDMANYFILGELRQLFSNSFILFVSVLLTLIFSLLAAGKGYFRASPKSVKKVYAGKSLLVAGGFLLGAAAFPYIAVDQNLASEGWLSRNCILTPLPLAMLIVGGLVCLNQAVCRDRPRIWVAPLSLLIFIWIGLNGKNYLEWQGFGLKQMAIQSAMKQVISQKKVAVIQLRDYFMIPRTIYYYHPIVWTYMAAEGLPSPATYVFETVRIVPDQQSLNADGHLQISVPQIVLSTQELDQAIMQGPVPYAMEAIPRKGPQVLILVRPGKYGISGAMIGAKYLWLKHTAPAQLPEFVQQVAQIDVFDLPPVGAR